MNTITASRLAGKAAIVTGAGQGIGRSIAIRLAEEGAFVTVVGRSVEPIQHAAQEIIDAGGNAEAISADISSETEVAALIDTVYSRHGKIDILVNNAAIFDEPPFLESTAEAFRNTFETNVVGTFLMSQAAAKHMVAAGNGSIVHISSLDAFGADGPYPAYNASKAAVSALARAMTMELAPLGVRVNTVAPGFVNTDMLHKTSTPNVIAHMLNNFTRVPLRRMVEPEEIAAAVAFLASDDASAVSGIDLLVDGGLTSNLFVYETLPDPLIPLGS